MPTSYREMEEIFTKEELDKIFEEIDAWFDQEEERKKNEDN